MREKYRPYELAARGKLGMIILADPRSKIGESIEYMLSEGANRSQIYAEIAKITREEERKDIRLI
jgi:hypothetical protein